MKPLIMIWAGDSQEQGGVPADASWLKEKDFFGQDRWILVLPENIRTSEEIRDILKSHHARVRELGCHYPLYIEVGEEDLEPIRILSRLDALPYLGESSWWSKEENTARWQKVTERLRLESGMIPDADVPVQD